MRTLNISIDVGGTHSRLQCEIIENNQILQKSDEYKEVIGSKKALKDFIKSSLTNFAPDLTPNKCVIGFAGAIIDRREVEMTNWVDRPIITKNDLVDWGLPTSTFMVNDMELAGYGLLDMELAGSGLLDMEAKNLIPSEFCKTLFLPKNQSNKYSHHKLIIAPGTGFGTGCIVEIKSQSGEIFYEVISSEVQHIQIPSFDEKHARIMKIMSTGKRNRNYLNHEDFVSGQGLEDIYAALQQLSGKKNSQKKAGDIAALALKEEDSLAVEALNYFYRVAGRIAQAMCLVIQPYGGVFLCGASTVKNADFISHSDFLKELHNSLVRKQLLEQFPVYIITKSNINIAGGLWVVRNKTLSIDDNYNAK